MGSEQTGKRIVAVFLKFPEAGKVKTRLGGTIGYDAAANVYRQLVGRVLEQIARNSSADALALCFDPPEKESEIRHWLAPHVGAFPGEVIWLAQCAGDLGARLTHATGVLFKQNPDACVAVTGTDCLQLDAGIFCATWEALASVDCDVVIGPCEDGGYFLIGLSRSLPLVFENIPWSQDNTFSATVDAAKAKGLSVHCLEEHSDIDNEEDWFRFKLQLEDRPCVFFDRDGVVNRSPGSGYVLRWEDFHLNEGIAEALRMVRDNGYLAILITSQKGVGKGLMSQEDLDRIHRNLQTELVKRGAAFDGIYAFTGMTNCPHRAKPDPEMILAAAHDFCINLNQSWMIGDADRDIEMGKAAKLGKTIRIKGDKPIAIDADHTLDSILKLPELFRKYL